MAARRLGGIRSVSRACRRSDVLAVLSNALNYAEQARVIARAPYVGLFKVERPEIGFEDGVRQAELAPVAAIELAAAVITGCAGALATGGDKNRCLPQQI